jgi:hypothetical protein
MIVTPTCLNKQGHPKERFATEHAAKRALARKHKFRGRRWPHVYLCSCKGYHLTGGNDL